MAVCVLSCGRRWSWSCSESQWRWVGNHTVTHLLLPQPFMRTCSLPGALPQVGIALSNIAPEQAAVFHVSFKKCMYRAKTEVRIENKICITQIHNYKLTVPTVWLFTYLCSYSVSKGKYIFHIVAVTTVPAFFMSRDISDTSLWS